MANKGQRMIFEDEYQYLKDLKEEHPDPSASWGGGGGGGEYTAGTGIDITGDVISVDTETVAMKTDIPDVSDFITENEVDVKLEDYELKADAFSGSYNDLTDKPTIPTDTSDLTNGAGFITSSALSGYATETWVGNQGYITGINSSDVITALGYTPGTSNFDGDYNSLTNKPTIPTDTSDLTNGAGFITGINSSDVTTALGYTPTNPSSLATVATSGSYNDLTDKPTIPDTSHMVTDNTNQTITGEKTFQGTNLIKFKGYPSSQTMGFTAYANDNSEIGNLQIKERSVSVKNGVAQDLTLTTLGNYSTQSSKNSATGFRISSQSGNNKTYNFIAPYADYTSLVNTYGSTYDTYFIPMAVTDGTNTVFANYTGKVDISSLLPTVPTNVSAFTNDSGYITGINSSDVTTALGFTPSVVSGTNDGTNWTSLTVDGDTYSIPSGGSTPSNMVTTDTDQTITGRKTIVGSTVGLYVQSGATFTSSDTMILPGEINTRSVSGIAMYSNEFAMPDVTTAGNGQIRVRDFSQGGPFTDYRITVPTANGTMALTSDITTVAANTGATPSATLTSLQVGSTVYEVPQGGGGSSYTFTNGLTESSGTVSWDLNDKIKFSVTTPSSGLEGPCIISGKSPNNVLIDLDSNGFISRSGNLSNYSSANVLVGAGNRIETSGIKRNVILGKDNKISSSGAEDCIILGKDNTNTGISRSVIIGTGNTGSISNQIIIGTYADTSVNKALIIGNGTSSSNRKNIMTVDSDGTIISKNLPAAPSTAGTYTLQATVDAQGNVTYNWV